MHRSPEIETFEVEVVPQIAGRNIPDPGWVFSLNRQAVEQDR